MGLAIYPPADFTRSIAARQMPFFATPGNTNMPVQSALFASAWFQWSFNATAAGGNDGRGPVLSNAGTSGSPAQATTNLYTAQLRETYANVITTTNQQVGLTNGTSTFFRGSVAGQGGFLFACRFGTEVWTAGARLFVGLAAATTALVTGQPSAVVNMVGFGIDASDSAITFMHNDGSGTATKDTIAGQPTLATNQGYDAYIFCKPNDSIVYYRLDDVLLGTTIIDTSTNTDLPVNTTLLGCGAVMGNAALTAAAAAKIGVATIYLETDR